MGTGGSGLVPDLVNSNAKSGIVIRLFTVFVLFLVLVSWRCVF